MFTGRISDGHICLGHTVRDAVRKLKPLEGIFWYFKSIVVLYLFFVIWGRILDFHCDQ